MSIRKCKLTLDSVYPLETYKEAFKRLDSRRARDMVVLDLITRQNPSSIYKELGDFS